MIERAFIEPVNAQADAITDLLKTLEYYRDLYANPDRWLSDAYEGDVHEMVREFRRVAATLAARNRTIPWYVLLRAFGIVPRRADVCLATAEVKFISRIVTFRPRDGVEWTEDNTKVPRDGLLMLERNVKDRLNVGDQPIAEDLGKMMLAMPKEQFEALMRTMDKEH